MKKATALVCAFLLAACAASRKQTVETREEILTEISGDLISAKDAKQAPPAAEAKPAPVERKPRPKEAPKPPVEAKAPPVVPATPPPAEEKPAPVETPAEKPAGNPPAEELLAKANPPSAGETKRPAKPALKSVVDFSQWRGECLIYDLRWSFLGAGQGMMACQEEQANGNRVYHLVGLTLPAGAAAALGFGYTRVDSYIDPETMLPYYYYSYSRGGKNSKVLEIWFNRAKGEYSWRLKKYRDQKLYTDRQGVVPYKEPLYDSMSVFYALRSTDLARSREHAYPVGIMKIWDLVVRVVDRKIDAIKNVGDRDVYVVEPKATSDEGMFKGKMTIWLTADERKVPIYVTARMGPGTGELVYNGRQVLAENVPLDNKTIARLLTPAKSN